MTLIKISLTLLSIYKTITSCNRLLAHAIKYYLLYTKQILKNNKNIKRKLKAQNNK